jgi:hypothetical protein
MGTRMRMKRGFHLPGDTITRHIKVGSLCAVLVVLSRTSCANGDDRHDCSADRPRRRESPPSTSNGMVSEKADMQGIAMHMRKPAPEQQKWERGRDVAELEVSLIRPYATSTVAHRTRHFLQQPYGYGGNQAYRDQDQPYQQQQQSYQQHHQQGHLDYEGYGGESMNDNSRPPSEPSRDVIFLGLDLNVDEEVVSHKRTVKSFQSLRAHCCLLIPLARILSC